MKKFILFFLILGICSCEFGNELKRMERAIRAEVIKESAGIASLEAIYLVSYYYVKKNFIYSDDIYTQKDNVFIDYGFRIDENSLSVVEDNGVKKLRVRLKKGEALAINRTNLEKPEKTHSDFWPVDEKGKHIDIDAEINNEIESIKKKYDKQNLKLAEENIRNFFVMLAVKYGLELDFAVEM